jgi:hypothetical protein
MLPAGPQWKHKRWKTKHPTKQPLHLYYRDPIDCLKTLMSSPLLQDHIHFTPLRIFKTAEKLCRVYSEWMTGNRAWDTQVSRNSYVSFDN